MWPGSATKYGEGITIRPQILVDGETWTADNSWKLNGRSNIVQTRNLTSRSMEFLRRSFLLLVCSLAFGLVCSEIPESIRLCEDTSNDFVESTPAPKIDNVQTNRHEISSRQDKARRIATSPILRDIYCPEPAPSSGPDLLQLLSIQRK
jgi:hypothetical protein